MSQQRREGRRVHFSGKRPLSPESRRSLRSLLIAVLDERGGAGDLSVVYVDDKEIAAIHEEFLGKRCATDVITFPMDDADERDEGSGVERLIGEIVVSVETAARESRERGIPLEREIALYTLHGVLHLVGFDDILPEDRRKMRRAEREYLKRFSESL